MPPDNAQDIVQAAVEAEQAGWDAFFLADGMWCVDAWLCLAAAATRTSTIHLGTLLTLLSIMRPWKVAAEATTLDHLSNGRAILTIGLGATDVGFTEFGKETDLRTRADRVDEGLAIITQLWRGQPFAYQGHHYHVDTTSLKVNMPRPVQQPRLPIWVAGAWPRPKSMQRVLSCDGVIPVIKPKGEAGRPVTPADVREIKAWLVDQHRSPIDVVIEGQTPGMTLIRLKSSSSRGLKPGRPDGLNQSGGSAEAGCTSPAGAATPTRISAERYRSLSQSTCCLLMHFRLTSSKPSYRYASFHARRFRLPSCCRCSFRDTFLFSSKLGKRPVGRAAVGLTMRKKPEGLNTRHGPRGAAEHVTRAIRRRHQGQYQTFWGRRF